MARLARRAAGWCGGDRLAVNCAGVEGQRDPVSRSIYALSGFSGASYYKSASGGGEPGASTGFGYLIAFRLRAAVAATSVLLRRLAGNSGYQLYLGAGATGTAHFGTGGALGGFPLGLSASDVGRVHVFVLRLTPMPGTIEGLIDGSWRPAIGLGAYAPGAGVPTALGNDETGANASPDIDILGALTFTGNPSQAQLDALVADTRARNGVPPESLAGGTITHRWSVADELRGSAVVDGQAAPAQLTDTVTLAAGHALVRQGSPIVRVIDPATARWAYENYPIMYGVGAFLEGDYLETPGGLAGSPAGCWFACLFRVETQAITGRVRVLMSKSNGNNAGWDLRTSGTNSIATFTATDAGGVGAAGPGATITASDVGRLLLLIGTWDGAKMHVYFKRAEVATGLARSGWSNSPTAPMRLGRHSAAANINANSVSLFGAAMGDGVLSLAEVQALHDACQTQERMVAVPGKTATLYDFTSDIAANGGVMPATLLDRIGTDNLARVGAPTAMPMNTRAWGY